MRFCTSFAYILLFYKFSPETRVEYEVRHEGWPRYHRWRSVLLDMDENVSDSMLLVQSHACL